MIKSIELKNVGIFKDFTWQNISTLNLIMSIPVLNLDNQRVYELRDEMPDNSIIDASIELYEEEVNFSL